MIDEVQLDAALLWIATDMEPKNPKAVLKRWQRFFPVSVYPFLVAEYRRRTGGPTFTVTREGNLLTLEARIVIEQFRRLTNATGDHIAGVSTQTQPNGL